MVEYDQNLYYFPEKSGFSIFSEVDTAGSYEFDTFLILKREKDNTLWYTSDAGCSCPTPFENCRVADLKRIAKNTFEDFARDLLSHNNLSTADYMMIRKKVRDHLHFQPE